MGITETQSWDSVVAQLSSRCARRIQPNEPLLRVLRELREHAAAFELYPEAHDDELNFYDEQIYDATFRMRQLSLRFERKTQIYSVHYVFCGSLGQLDEHDAWSVREKEIVPFLLERLSLLAWRRCK